MKITNRFPFGHKNHPLHPLFASAKAIYRSLRAIQFQPSAGAKANQVDRVADKLRIAVGEAISLSGLRARRLAAAQAHIARLILVLDILQEEGAIEARVFERVSDELEALADALETFSRQEPQPARQNRRAKPDPVAAESTGMSPEIREPDAVLAPSSVPPEPDESGNGSGSHEHGANGSLGAAGAAASRLGVTEVPALEPTKLASR